MKAVIEAAAEHIERDAARLTSCADVEPYKSEYARLVKLAADLRGIVEARWGRPSTPDGRPDDARIYPCDDCGTMRSKAEGGTVFTVCDACWDKRHGKPMAPTPDGRLEARYYERVMGAIRNPDVPLEGTVNFALLLGCRKCLSEEHPYWHPKEQPCAKPSTALAAPLSGERPSEACTVELCGSECSIDTPGVDWWRGGRRYCSEACYFTSRPATPGGTRVLATGSERK